MEMKSNKLWKQTISNSMYQQATVRLLQGRNAQGVLALAG